MRSVPAVRLSEILNLGANVCYFVNAQSARLGIFNPEWTHSEHIGAGRDAKGNEFFTTKERFLPLCKI